MKAKIHIWQILLLLAIVGAACWYFVAGRLPQSKIRNVVLISIDTCRADYLSCYGYERKTTPNIDAIAAKSILFETVVSPVPMTLPAHSSLMTGTIPPYHGVRLNNRDRLEDSNVTLAEIFKDNGIATGAVISAFVLNRYFGINQGFDDYIDEIEKTKKTAHNGRTGIKTSELAIKWLSEHKNEPFFFFLHYFDPHLPYIPPEPFATEFADNLYAGEIAYTDYCIGLVIEQLKELGLYDSTLIIITGDHGEGLKEHSETEHGFFIYDCTIKVPLIIKVPGRAKGKRVSEVVGLIDLAPTICSIMGITVTSEMHGEDLSGFFTKKDKTAKDQRYLYCESFIPRNYGCAPLLGVVNGHWKYIQAPKEELYDLNKDPGETENLINRFPKRARLLQSHLGLILQYHTRSDKQASNFKLDAESMKRLESLGYVGSSDIHKVFKFDKNKEDPKDLIHIRYGQESFTLKDLTLFLAR